MKVQLSSITKLMGKLQQNCILRILKNYGRCIGISLNIKKKAKMEIIYKKPTLKIYIHV